MKMMVMRILWTDNEYNENTKNDASLLGGGEHDVPSPIFRELNYEGGSTPMDPNSPRSELMYHDDMVYEG